MSFINDILNSGPFRAMFPVQGLDQSAVQAVTGMSPSSQYAAGAGVGAGMAGLGALGGSPSTGSSIMKALSMMRGAGGGGGQQQQTSQNQTQQQLIQSLYAMFPELMPKSKTGAIGNPSGGQPWQL